jgi:hypothetical protein
VATIREYIQGNLGETYSVLVNDGGYDGSGDKPDVFGLAIDRTVSLMLADGVTEDEITSEFVKSYLADVSTRFVIPVAIDYIMERTGTSDRIGSPPVGNQNLRNETRTYYNRISALKDIDGILAARVSVSKGDFAVVAGRLVRSNTGGRTFAADVSTRGQGFVTIDPLTFPYLAPPFVYSPGFGIVAVKSDPVIVQSQVVLVSEGGGGPIYP